MQKLAKLIMETFISINCFKKRQKWESGHQVWLAHGF